MNGDSFNWHWSFGVGHWIVVVLLWVSVFFAVFYAARGTSGGSARSGSKVALRIVKERYASGEIDKDEYERMWHDLAR